MILNLPSNASDLYNEASRNYELIIMQLSATSVHNTLTMNNTTMMAVRKFGA
jgi:hypothetical protein